MKRASDLLDRITEILGFGNKRITRFLRYNISAGIATILDIILLWLFTDLFGIYYLLSAGMAFSIGSAVNYSINRVWAFKNSKTRILNGYFTFLIIGIVGLGLTIGLLAFFVEILRMNYLIARGLAVFIIVFWNYSMNAWITFRDVKIKKP